MEQENQVQEVVLNKEDILYEVDVQLDSKILYDYMLRHGYTGLTGPLGTFIGLLCILFFVKSGAFLYLVMGVIIILYLPWNYFLMAKRQAMTDSFRKPLHYSFTKDGIYVSQGDVLQMQRWEDLHKAVSTGKSIIVYTSKKGASIFPRKDLGENTVILLELLCRYMEPSKVKFKQ